MRNSAAQRVKRVAQGAESATHMMTSVAQWLTPSVTLTT